MPYNYIVGKIWDYDKEHETMEIEMRFESKLDAMDYAYMIKQRYEDCDIPEYTIFICESI